ncbi:3-oxoacyl-[acyl-carrier-protein] reductase [Anaerosacchariphilus polymeriproducens]|uniref:3-oxoacyl-[acyl-carrier-protein] reductase n=1 Tax=Anaerosacchariphilus polymeriproducens TaxID=1812858 RepID=A0A371AUR7_9FIRM|nr:3-oxoacyl-[acyl-carrier-protein] reductase [Anaerosacchariphilus polymeriproducens]RDU23315.1 3-oxoacyl-[acyl-carrier-protein] reductase [Anaerosacchariphilus polymeriproducens]
MFQGKVALITGASRGLGREIALTLAQQGAKVVVNYNGSKDKAEEVVEKITNNGGEAISYQCNVSDFQAVEIMVKEVIAKFGRVDILVNSAGITKDNLIVKMKEEDFDQVIDINLKGTFNTIKHVSRQMLKQRAGKIINITSVSGVLGNIGQANYSASKAGVIGLTKTMARELASRGINVNAVAPGFIETEMTAVYDESQIAMFVEQIPFKRLGKPDEVAQVVSFLASEQASYITGQIIHIDGGMAI